MKKGIAILIVITLVMGMMSITSFASENESLITNIKKVLDKGEDYFKQIAKRFTDMGNHWGNVTVGKLVDLGILDGYDNGTFKPDNTITRAEFAKVVRTSLKLEIQEGNSFDDTTNHWAKNEVHTLVMNGIIDKNEYGQTYKPNKNITRLEMAKMIVRAVDFDEKARELKGQKTKFNDDNTIKSEDKGYIIIANKNSIINGYPNNTFVPNGEATRAEASQMIVNMFNALDKGIKVVDNNEEEKEIFPEPEFEIFYPNHEDVFIYEIEIKNIEDYSDDCEFNIQYINYPKLNVREWNSYFDPSHIYKLDIREQWTAAKFKKLQEGYIHTLPKNNYTTFEHEKEFKLKEGMVMKYKITIRKDDKEKEYYLNAEVKF